MKRYFLTPFIAAGLLAAAPAFAQPAKGKSKSKEGDVQTIVITRDGDVNGKTVVEINGSQVLVNGKEADKSPDVNVNVTTVKRGGHVSVNGIGGRDTWVYSDDGARFFSDSSNIFSVDEHRAMLGVITDIDPKGARVSEVSPQSAAEKAGLKKDDIITRIGDSAVRADGDVARAIRAHKPGDKVKITYLRDGKEATASAELTAWHGMGAFMNDFGKTFDFQMPEINFEMPTPPAAPSAPHAFVYRTADRPRLGVSVQDTEDGKGVKVTGVDSASSAAKSGIKEGDIITKVDGDAIEGTDELRRATAGMRQGSAFTFTVIRAGKEQAIEVKIPRKIKTANL